MNNQSDRGGNPKRERRWQTSQERARVAAELIEEAESLTQTGAIASPNDVARDRQPPPQPGRGDTAGNHGWSKR